MKKLLSILSLLSCSLFGNIFHHNQFESILHYITPSDHNRYTFVVIDIDNTVATPMIVAGSDQWVSHEMKKRMQQGLAPRQAWLAIKDLYVALQHAIDLMLVEDVIPDIIRELCSRGIIVIILTARLPEIRHRTIEQLKRININLHPKASLWHEELISDCDIYYHYQNGIIFCDGNDKGTVLASILNRINHWPKKIIAIDDKEKNLHDIKRALPDTIEFIGIRYGYLDEVVALFDPIQAEKDLQNLVIV